MLEYCLGRFDRALDLFRRSADADPLSMIGPSYIARVYHSAGRLPEAEAELRAILALSTSTARERSMLAFVLLGQGRAEEALAEADAAVGWARLWSRAVVCWALGRKDESDEALRQLEEQFAESSAYQVAQVHAIRGEKDAAFRWLEHACETRDAGVALAKVSPQLAGLHDDPRWGEFLRRVGLEA